MEVQPVSEELQGLEPNSSRNLLQLQIVTLLMRSANGSLNIEHMYVTDILYELFCLRGKCIVTHVTNNYALLDTYSISIIRLCKFA